MESWVSAASDSKGVTGCSGGTGMCDRRGMDTGAIEGAVRTLLAAVGDDPDREGLRDTPARVARAYGELLRGYEEDPGAHLERQFEVDHDELVIVRDIPFSSLCEHHLLPFIGRAHVAYIPGDEGR